MIPDCERVVGDYLREHPDVDARVIATSPHKTDTAWIRITQLDDRAVGNARSDHLIAFVLQLDIYAGATGGQPEASALNRAVRAALAAMPDAEDLDAVVSGVAFNGAARIPDTDVDDPARERYVRTVTVWMHA